MNETVSIEKSVYSMWVQTIALGFIAVCFGAFGLFFIDRLLSETSFKGTVLKVVLLLGLLIAWLLRTLAIWLRRGLSIYEFTPSSMIVQTRSGLFGMRRSEYRIDSITSLELHQGYLGRLFGYGDIHVCAANAPEKIVMKDVEQPEKQLKIVQAMIDKK